MAPPIQYARSGDVNIAYQVTGDGPHDLLMIPGWVAHLGLDWNEPRWVRWFERMTSFARVVRFDKRGTGMSDRTPGVPTPDERMGTRPQHGSRTGRLRSPLRRTCDPQPRVRPR